MKVAELINALGVYNPGLSVEVEVNIAGNDEYRDGVEHREVYDIDVHMKPYGSGSAPIVRLRT